MTIAADVSEERLRRFFIKEQRLSGAPRDARDGAVRGARSAEGFAVLAARPGLVPQPADLPEPRRAARAFDIFHFALRPGGRCSSASSESVDDDSSLFAVIDKKYRLYEPAACARATLPVLLGTSTLARSLELKEKSGERPAVPKTDGGAARRREWPACAASWSVGRASASCTTD